MIGMHPQVRIELSRSFRRLEVGPVAEHRPPVARPRSRGLRPGSVARRVVPGLRPQQLRP
jgi:hypothetical protein